MTWHKALEIIVISFLAVGTLLAAVLSFSTVLFWNLKTSGSGKLRRMLEQHELQEEKFGFLYFWAFGSIVASFFMFKILFEQLGVV